MGHVLVVKVTKFGFFLQGKQQLFFQRNAEGTRVSSIWRDLGPTQNPGLDLDPLICENLNDLVPTLKQKSP